MGDKVGKMVVCFGVDVDSIRTVAEGTGVALECCAGVMIGWVVEVLEGRFTVCVGRGEQAESKSTNTMVFSMNFMAVIEDLVMFIDLLKSCHWPSIPK